MTDSPTNNNPSDVAFEVGSSVDDLFGELETGEDSGDERRTATDRRDEPTSGRTSTNGRDPASGPTSTGGRHSSAGRPSTDGSKPSSGRTTTTDRTSPAGNEQASGRQSTPGGNSTSDRQSAKRGTRATDRRSETGSKSTSDRRSAAERRSPAGTRSAGGRSSSAGRESARRGNSDGVEDQTAAEVFDQLRADAGNTTGADEILADESPEDIIASADEPEPEPKIADELLADDDELADLLLTGRTKGEEFLWVKTDSSNEPSTGSPTRDRGTAGDRHLSEARDRRRRPKNVEFGSGGETVTSDGGTATSSTRDTRGAESEDAPESDDDESTGLIGGIRSLFGG